MHELGICEDILGAVERRAAGRRVTGVRVRIGAGHRVSEPALAQAFAQAAAGTIASGARIDLVPVPMRFRCRTCGAKGETDDPFNPCSACGAVDIDVSGGDELLLESISVTATQPPTEGSTYVSRHRG